MQLGKKIAPPRFLIFLVLLAVTSGVATRWLTPGEAAMAGFDVAALAFLLSLWPLFDSAPDDIRDQARANDANRILLLVVTGVVMIVILAAVAVELSGRPDKAAVALVIATLVLAWLFSNTVYALHYADLFYSAKGGEGGLKFPECDEPDYWDFCYFSYTLGMTFQTSDVDIASRDMRRVATGHTLAAFVFNLGVVAFTINVLGG